MVMRSHYQNYFQRWYKTWTPVDFDTFANVDGRHLAVLHDDKLELFELRAGERVLIDSAPLTELHEAPFTTLDGGKTLKLAKYERSA